MQIWKQETFMQIALSILFHFYLLVLVRVLSHLKHIWIVTCNFSKTLSARGLHLIVTKKILRIKNLVRIILSQYKHGKITVDHLCNIEKYTLLLLQGVGSVTVYLSFGSFSCHIKMNAHKSSNCFCRKNICNYLHLRLLQCIREMLML